MKLFNQIAKFMVPELNVQDLGRGQYDPLLKMN